MGTAKTSCRQNEKWQNCNITPSISKIPARAGPRMEPNASSGFTFAFHFHFSFSLLKRLKYIPIRQEKIEFHRKNARNRIPRQTNCLWHLWGWALVRDTWRGIQSFRASSVACFSGASLPPSTHYVTLKPGVDGEGQNRKGWRDGFRWIPGSPADGRHMLGTSSHQPRQ